MGKACGNDFLFWATSAPRTAGQKADERAAYVWIRHIRPMNAASGLSLEVRGERARRASAGESDSTAGRSCVGRCSTVTLSREAPDCPDMPYPNVSRSLISLLTCRAGCRSSQKRKSFPHALPTPECQQAGDGSVVHHREGEGDPGELLKTIHLSGSLAERHGHAVELMRAAAVT